METPISFSLTHSDQLSDETYSVYMILVFPEIENAKPKTVVVLPVNRETLEVNVVNLWGDPMPTGVRVGVTVNEETHEEGIDPESLSEVVIPRIFTLMSMTITGYNFLDQDAQAVTDLLEREAVPTEDLPEAPAFEFETADDFLDSLG